MLFRAQAVLSIPEMLFSQCFLSRQCYSGLRQCFLSRQCYSGLSHCFLSRLCYSGSTVSPDNVIQGSVSAFYPGYAIQVVLSIPTMLSRAQSVLSLITIMLFELTNYCIIKALPLILFSFSFWIHLICKTGVFYKCFSICNKAIPLQVQEGDKEYTMHYSKFVNATGIHAQHTNELLNKSLPLDRRFKLPVMPLKRQTYNIACKGKHVF